MGEERDGVAVDKTGFAAGNEDLMDLPFDQEGSKGLKGPKA